MFRGSDRSGSKSSPEISGTERVISAAIWADIKSLGGKCP